MTKKCLLITIHFSDDDDDDGERWRVVSIITWAIKFEVKSHLHAVKRSH